MAVNFRITSGAAPVKWTYVQVSQASDRVVMKGEELKGELKNDRLLSEVKRVFRDIVSSWAFKSRIMYRGFSKPKGYPGDYETLEMIYDNKPLMPRDDLGFYYDKYFLDNPYAFAVRKRKDKMRSIIEALLSEKGGTIRILNLACGGCKEIREICDKSAAFKAGQDIHITCVDWDADAIAFSKRMLSNIPKNFHIGFVEENVISLLRNTHFYDKIGKQDVIYNIGLADYFPDRVLKSLIKNAFGGLKPGGKFIIAHKDKNVSFSHMPPEWFCDWVFYPRNEEGLLDIINSIGLGNVEITKTRDETGNIFFYILTKK
jgi:SAM-dependent methyltransferase